MHPSLKFYEELVEAQRVLRSSKKDFFGEIKPKIEFVLKTISNHLQYEDNIVFSLLSLSNLSYKRESICNYRYFLKAAKYEDYEHFSYLIRFENREYDILDEFPFDWLFLNEEQIKEAMKDGFLNERR